MEKRAHKRYHHDVPIVYKVGTAASDSYFGAETNNYSTGGISFLSNHALEPGAGVIIAWTDLTDLPTGLLSIKDTGPDSCAEDEYRACKGEIVWCREISGNSAFCFENGVRFKEVDIRLG